MLMGSEVAYKLSISWDKRYTALRRVCASDFESTDKKDSTVSDEEEASSKSKLVKLFPLG